jgi:RIO kinase 1
LSNINAFLNDHDDSDDFTPAGQDRQARRRRKPLANPHDRKRRREGLAEAVDPAEMTADFSTTYTPSRYEEGWLLQSLRGFYERALLSDVLAVVKGGKEASVYRCQGHPDSGLDLVAAKVYRPRMFRNLRNDHAYRQGREILTPDGRPVGKDADRVARAIGKKSAYGQQISHTSWLMYEYTTLEMLYNAGCAVPQPIAAGGNAILMGYIGDEYTAAPTLHEVTLTPDEVQPLYDRMMRDIDLMLQHNVIHGDLSAFNILYWASELTIIDFPQVVDPRKNRKSYDILMRDITRVVEYFQRQGAKTEHPAIIHRRLWQRYVGQTPAERAREEAMFSWEPDIDDD